MIHQCPICYRPVSEHSAAGCQPAARERAEFDRIWATAWATTKPLRDKCLEAERITPEMMNMRFRGTP